MRIIGKRKIPEVAIEASPEMLVIGCHFNDEIHRLPTGNVTHIPKGVFPFRTHEDANEFDQICLANRMASIAQERLSWTT